MAQAHTIYLAGGCFWGMEAYFKKIPGVLSTEVGYANGKVTETNYQIVAATDHAETLKLTYDYDQIRLQELCLHFLRLIDPLAINKQGGDEGRQYRTGIYYSDAISAKIAAHVLELKAQELGQKLAVELEPIRHFIKAEDYHQDYLSKNASGYCHIDLNLRKQSLLPSYQALDLASLKAKLSPLAFEVTQNAATEAPHSSDLDQVFAKGIYVSVTSGEPLFLSDDKFDAGCGWPSFSRPILSEQLSYATDYLAGYARKEVRTSLDQAHLGHVFNDGPLELGGNRYCINGAALSFVPVSKMAELGYAACLPLLLPNDVTVPMVRASQN